jgi:hypothetical protein
LALQTQSNCINIRSTRAAMREQTNILHGAERTMNQIIADTNVVETEVSELQTLQMEDALFELSSAQLMMVGGGGQVILN